MVYSVDQMKLRSLSVAGDMFRLAGLGADCRVGGRLIRVGGRLSRVGGRLNCITCIGRDGSSK